MSCGCGVILRDNLKEIETVITMSTLQEIGNPRKIPFHVSQILSVPLPRDTNPKSCY
jgi:hypothetical protein